MKKYRFHYEAQRWDAEDFTDLQKRMLRLSDEGHSLADDWADMARQAAADLAHFNDLVEALERLLPYAAGWDGSASGAHEVAMDKASSLIAKIKEPLE
jgi:hypothetical protein